MTHAMEVIRLSIDHPQVSALKNYPLDANDDRPLAVAVIYRSELVY